MMALICKIINNKLIINYLKQFCLNRQDVKTFAVVFAKAIFLYGLPVGRRSIALILVPPVLGKLQVQLPHPLIAPGFGQYAGGGNGGVSSITFHHANMRRFWVGFKPVAVNQQQAGPYLKPVNSQVHGAVGGLQNIDIVYFSFAYFGHPPGQCFFFNNSPQLIPVSGCYLFRIVQ